MTPAAFISFAGSLNAHPAVSQADSSEPTGVSIAPLTRRLAAGDDAAFREFHGLYFDRLYHFLLVLTRGEAHAAQDALQETLLRVVRHAREFENEEIFWSWLKAIARSAACDGGRKQRRYLARLRDFALGRPALFADAAPSPAPDHLRAQLAEALATLPSSDRDLVEGKYLRGETIAELAAQAGLTEKAVESRLGRLRRQLGESVRQKLRASS